MEIRRPNARDTVDVWVGLTEEEVEQMKQGFFHTLIERVREVVNL